MRLETSNGKKYYCGRLRYAPDYVNGYSSVGSASVVIDGFEATFYMNRLAYRSKITVFELNDEWFYISDEDLKDKVYSGEISGTQFITAGAKEKRKVVKQPSYQLYGGRTHELIGDSKIATKETNDCTVKALMEAARIPYDQAHKRLRPYRGHRKGVHGFHHVMKSFKDFKHEPLQRPITLGTFVKDAVGGRYVVSVRGHALAVVNGKIYDHSIRPGRKVQNVYKYIGRNK